MRVRRRSLALVVLIVAVVAAGAIPAVLATDAVAQRGGPGGGGMDGNGGGMGGDRAGGPNVSVGSTPDGGHSIMVRNVGGNQTIRVRFRYQSGGPGPGMQMRAMTVTTNRGGDYRFTVRTAANASPGVRRFDGPAPFGYFNVTHAFPNRNVSNASLTFALDRTRLRERNVSAANVSLYRYHAGNRTWDRLRTRVTERNATHVTYRAESPGLSEFAAAPTAAESTATPTETATPTATPSPTATPTSSPTPTEGGGPGFGPVVAVLAVIALAVVARRTGGV